MSSEVQLKAAQSNSSKGAIAFVFPGSGSQCVGMCRDVYDRYGMARQVLSQADAILGFPLSELCFEGPAEALNDTWNAQPAMVACSLALLAALHEQVGAELLPAFVAGHSTGEYTALVAAGILDSPSALRLVRERARLMKKAGETKPGAMAAVLGLEADLLRSISAEVGDVWVANDNAPEQVVISGTKPAVERALQLAAGRGAKKAIPLAVNIASHCPLMAPATESLAAIIAQLHLSQARTPVVVNVSATAISQPEEVRRELVQHLTSPVRWVESVRYMISHGVRTFVEVGPKNVLCGLIKRIDRSIRTVSIGSVADIQAWETYG